MTTTQEEMSDRQVAAQRLEYLLMLQLRQRRRRRMADVPPWRDPAQGQGRVIALLKMKPEMTQRELTYLIGMSRQALAELLSKLERQGLIERTPSPQDRRVMNVRLTKDGQAVEQSMDPDRGVASAALVGLDDAEAAQFASCLGKVIDALEASSPEDPREREVRREFVRHVGGRRGRGRGRFPMGMAGRGGWPMSARPGDDCEFSDRTGGW